jgi:hypothetical protein
MIAGPGMVRTRATHSSEPGAESVDLGVIKLDDEVPIRGVVVDQDGNPAPKVQVYADYDYENKATTDAKGQFTIGGTGTVVKTLHVQSNDYFAPKPFDLGEDRDHVRLTVIKAYEIHGTAVDAETGKPVAIDTVRLCMVSRDPDGTVNLRG